MTITEIYGLIDDISIVLGSTKIDAARLDSIVRLIDISFNKEALEKDIEIARLNAELAELKNSIDKQR